MRCYFSLFLLFFSSFSLAEISQPIQGELGNGLRYILLPLHKEKNHLEVRVKVYAGAVDEADDQSGVAHMVEHSVFHASDKFPKEKYEQGIMTYLMNNKWMRGRNYNAVTTFDSTTYMMTPPVTSTLDDTLNVLSQMLFHAKLTQEELDSERKIIMEEWRQGQSVGNSMARRRTEAVRANSRYARRPVIGYPEDILHMPATQLQKFYQTWYQPHNMQLLITGDFQPEQATALVERYFSAVKAKAVPQRDYLDINLAERLTVRKVQDARSGVSQVAYIYRFDESQSKAQTTEGRYNRLLDRIALTAITKRLRNQQEQLPKGVDTIVVRKSDIGRNSVALGLFAGVGDTAHQLGLKQIFTEIERIKRYPITQSELDKLKETLQEQIETAKTKNDDRDFRQWMQVMSDTLLSDRPYLTQSSIARLTEPMLRKITPAEVNARIQQWFNAKDIVLQYQPPRKTEVTVFTESMVKVIQNEVQKNDIAAPRKESVVEPMSLEDISVKGDIVKETRYPKQNVVEWRLSNGDKAVWLKSDLNKDRTVFQAISSAGFKAQGLVNWQSQIASQLIFQNAPLDWKIEQLNRWKEMNKASLSVKQTDTKLIVSGSVPSNNLAALLRLYYAYQSETKVKDGLDEVKRDWRRNLASQDEKTDERERLKALSLLRYGVESLDSLPNKEELVQTTEADLNSQWQKMVTAPVTYYLINDMPEADVKALVNRFLTAVPRQKAFSSKQILPLTGKGETVFAMNPEPKADVKLWMFRPHQWQGKDAVLVSLLRNIATVKLKYALRDRAHGVYSLRFESSLNPQTERIESELTFTTGPEAADKLIAIAREVLRDLPDTVSDEEVELARRQFIQAEKSRMRESATWMNRLVLSEEQFGNPSYLSQMKHLAEEVSSEKIKAMAARIYSEENQKVFITTQKK
ncbi:pitrilysin family protein [Pasteurellaceae bacterium LIM206]|nr:pitrilysin family protein [Pasteurellaceae bacterium LIM206]